MKTIINNQDGESKTGDFGARHYDELSGRFLSVDPLWASFPDQTPYQYGYNNPVMFKDPSGLANETPTKTGGYYGEAPTCSACGQGMHNGNESDPLNPAGHVCGYSGGASHEAGVGRINAEFFANALHNPPNGANGRTMVSGGAEEVSGGSGGFYTAPTNPATAPTAKTGNGNAKVNNPENNESKGRVVVRSIGGYNNLSEEGHLGIILPCIVSTNTSHNFIVQGGPIAGKLKGTITQVSSKGWYFDFSLARGANWSDPLKTVQLKVYVIQEIILPMVYRYEYIKEIVETLNKEFQQYDYDYEYGPNSNTYIKIFMERLGVKYSPNNKLMKIIGINWNF